ncbi:MAG: isopeptide-forming domain-containing fimbrial protein [Clostridiales bacterium]|nr:isopeptide-forming domain-containing fimbrial protein [Candidatus Cacconaster stercorequi]
MKKLISILLTLAMALSLVTMNAFAAENNGSITIRNSVANSTYSVYKIFNATWGGDGKIAYTYDGELSENDYFAQDSAGNITAKKDAAGADGSLTAKAIAFLGTLKGEKPVATGTGNDGNLVFSKLPYGYYYIETTTGDKAVSIDSTMPNVTVIDKNTVPSWDNGGTRGEDPNPGKVIVNADGSRTTMNTVNYGDTVKFSIAVNAKAWVGEEMATAYYIRDTLADGFSPAEKIQVFVDGKELTRQGDGTAANGGYTLTQNGQSFEVAIPFGEKYGSEAKIEVTYSAAVHADGKDVVIGENGNLNTANFTYNTEPGTPENPPTVPETPPTVPGTPYEELNKKTTTTYVYALAIQKVDENGKPLSGAEFSVAGMQTSGSNGQYSYTGATAEGGKDTVMKTDADGLLVIRGVAGGNYAVSEEKAPAGYNKLIAAENIEATLTDAYTNTKIATYYYDKDGNMIDTKTEGGTEHTYQADIPAFGIAVVNRSGAELPSTGGMGTTVFYAIGSLLAVSAGVLLIAKKRMRHDGE